jgi:hypothetical protein
VIRAGIILLVLGIAHVLGWREYVCVLSGAHPEPGFGMVAPLAACLYLIAYFGAVLVAPVLLIAALVETVWNRLAQRKM